MTAIVGVLCRDGLVIGTDSSMTFGSGQRRTIEQPTDKLTVVEDTVIVAGTGQIGMGQRFNHIVQTAYNEKLFSKGHHIDVAKDLCKRGLIDFSYTSAKLGVYAALVGFPLNDRPYLCEFAMADFQPEFRDKRMWFVSMGSGQPITDPFLALMREIFWRAGPPTVQDAIFAVTWALDHAIAVNTGGINGPARIAVMDRVGGKLAARLLDENDLLEHQQHIEQAKEGLRAFQASQKPGAGDVPDVPKPAD